MRNISCVAVSNCGIQRRKKEREGKKKIKKSEKNNTEKKVRNKEWIKTCCWNVKVEGNKKKSSGKEQTERNVLRELSEKK